LQENRSILFYNITTNYKSLLYLHVLYPTKIDDRLAFKEDQSKKGNDRLRALLSFPISHWLPRWRELSSHWLSRHGEWKGKRGKEERERSPVLINLSGVYKSLKLARNFKEFCEYFTFYRSISQSFSRTQPSA
jgi:hypothetical protein